MNGLYRVCAKIYAPEPAGIRDDAAAFVPIFHDWIREGVLDMVAIDVADYAHVPESPGIMLVTHEAAFSLDRSDGRFGLHVQRRTPYDGSAADVIETTLRQALSFAARLEREPRLAGQLKFDAATPRIEANDRLRAPNSAEGFQAFAPVVREALERVYRGREMSLGQVANDPRDRLAVDVSVQTGDDVGEYLAA